MRDCRANVAGRNRLLPLYAQSASYRSSRLDPPLRNSDDLLKAGMVVSDGTFQRISIKHSGFNPDSVIEASFEVLTAVPDIMSKVQLFQDRILTGAEQLALATGAAAYRWEDLTKAPVSPSMLLNPRRYEDGAKDLWTTLNCVQENIIRGGQRARSRRRPDGSRMPKSRAIKGIDKDMKLNKALWEMAEVLRNRGAQ
jgi:Domain of unknown function (DUF932)